MRVAVFSAKIYDRSFLSAANVRFNHDLVFLEPCLELATAKLAEGFAGVCVFVNDCLDQAVLEQLKGYGVTLVALRCAGFNNIDLRAADSLGITVVRVPAYSPNAVAEFTIGLLLALERKIPRASSAPAGSARSWPARFVSDLAVRCSSAIPSQTPSWKQLVCATSPPKLYWNIATSSRSTVR
jgi:lactate dehydrogenase-like 2-hydroxyacid dehydrogenase